MYYYISIIIDLKTILKLQDIQSPAMHSKSCEHGH